MLCVAINRCRDLHRSAWKRRAELTDAVPDAGREDPRSDDAARALQDSELGRALGRLPDKMRLIVHLHYYEGFSTEEIARLVHCAPATDYCSAFATPFHAPLLQRSMADCHTLTI